MLPELPLLAGLALAFVLGAVTAIYVLFRWGQDRKRLRWEDTEKWRGVPQQLSEIVAVPVELRVGEHEVRSLSLVSVLLTAKGNSTLESIAGVIMTNPESEILGVRILEALEQIGNMSYRVDSHMCLLNITTLQPGDTALIEMAVRDYEDGSLNVELSDPQIRVRRSWTVGMIWRRIWSWRRNVGIGILGVRYDPSARALFIVIEELRTIRAMITRYPREPPDAKG